MQSISEKSPFARQSIQILAGKSRESGGFDAFNLEVRIQETSDLFRWKTLKVEAGARGNRRGLPRIRKGSISGSLHSDFQGDF